MPDPQQALRRLPLLALGGLTASGKSAIALDLAQHYPLSIITADAMQVYRGMNIGTAKPSAEEQERVPHHVLDRVTPAEAFSVAQWVQAAERAIVAVQQAERIPLVVGGTGFYLRALQQGLPSVPPADAALQAPLWQRFHKEGLEPLLQELESHAPDDAARCQRNPRRVVRALEILQRSGKPPSHFPLHPPMFDVHLLALMPTAAELRPRIHARVDSMMAKGLVAEVETLLRHYPEQPTALQAIGYKEVAAALRGEMPLTQATDAIKQATVKYAKRQRTWFKKMPQATLVDTTHEARALLQDWLERY